MPNAPKSKTSLRKLVKSHGSKAALRIARETNAPAPVQELAEALDKVTALACGQR